MKVSKFFIPFIVVLGITAFQSIFIVQEINQAIVLQFGDPKKIVNKSGLNFKLPFIQNVAYLDKRVLNLDNPPEEVIAADQKRLIVDAIARFKIVDPLKFYISVGNERVARQRLATIINSRIRGVLGKQELATLLSKDRAKQMSIIQNDVNTEAKNFGIEIVDPLKFYISVGNERVARQRLATIINSRIRGVLGKQELATLLSKDRAKQMSIIQNDVNTEAKNFGIEIVDVRIKRADLPQANSEAIYARMQTERQREAKEFRAQGAEIATRIKSTADKEVTVILANAKKKSEIMKGEGDGQRNKIFADAFGKDPQFFSFYRAMQSYEKALIGGDTSLILSPDSDFFKFFGKSGLIKKN